MKLFFSLCVCFVLSGFSGNSADWYVDKSTSGLTNGTSLVDAWRYMSNAMLGPIASGDTVWVKGGSYTNEHIDILNKQGITVKIHPSSTAPAIFQGSQIYKCANFTLDGYLLSAGTYGFKLQGISSFNQHTMFVRDSSNVVLRGIELTREAEFTSDTIANHLISLGSSTNNRIYIDTCYLHGTSADGINANFVVPTTDDYTSIVVTNCIIFGVADDGIQPSNGHTKIVNSVIDAGGVTAMFGGHPDGIQLNPDQGNLWVEGNKLKGFNQVLFVEWARSNVVVFNNVFEGDPTHITGTDRAMSVSARTNFWQGVYILANNTAVGFKTAAAWNSATSLPGLPGLLVRNNVFVDCRWVISAEAELLLDSSNVFWNTPGVVYYDTDGNVVSTPADQYAGDSLYSDTKLDELRRPLAGSSVINNGTSVASVFTTDKAGRIRVAPWESGAYEYDSGNALRTINAAVGVLLR